MSYKNKKKKTNRFLCEKIEVKIFYPKENYNQR